MNETGLTGLNVKKINKNKVYNYIYKEKTASKLQIVQQLQMGLSTVSQNLKILEAEGLISRNGFYDSTGGRKAHILQIVPDYKIALGIGILKNKIYIAATDLYGNIIHRTALNCPYASKTSYYRQLNQYLSDFIRENRIPEESLLGVSIATQGIIAPDGQSVSYGVIMDNADMKLADMKKYIPFPCRLEHDSKAAAYLELWNHKELKNAVVLLLNQNLGGALIINGAVHHGNNMRSGILEHLCIQPDGPLCYCGQKGCLETYCSANALEAASNMSIPDFFHQLEKHSQPVSRIWKDYLKHLAYAIRNLNIIFDGTIIISGYLAPYFQEEDVAYLVEQINNLSPFPINREQILLGTYGQYTPAVGGALRFVENFIASV